MKTRLALSFLVAAGAAQADQPDITSLVSDTIGYVQVRPNVVLLEGEDLGSYICRFEVSDSAFDSYAQTGKLPAGEVGYTCIPLEEFER